MNLFAATPRLRMFAGPNGSGKSSLKSVIDSNLLGVYINPVEIEAEIRQFDFLNFHRFGVETSENAILQFLQQSTLLEKADLLDEAESLRFNDNRLAFFDVPINPYFASVCADFIRQKLILARQSLQSKSKAINCLSGFNDTF